MATARSYRPRHEVPTAAEPRVEQTGEDLAFDRDLLSLVALHSDDGIIVTDGYRRTQWVNDAFTRLTGWKLDDMLGLNPADVLHGAETSPVTARAIVQVVGCGETFRGELVYYRQDCSTLWTDVNITPVPDSMGQTAHCVFTIRDVTVRRNAAQQMTELMAAVEASMDGIAVVDGFERFHFANDAFARLFGFARGTELQGKAWRRLYDRAQIRRFDVEVLPKLLTGHRWQGEVSARRRDGSTYPQELSLTLLPGASVVLVARDITEQKAAEEALRRMSLTDPLTGLNNRRGLRALGEHHLKVAARTKEPCVLFYMDLDDFKQINDEHGHVAGDEALREFAEVLRETFRASDILSRVGGDEFVVLAVADEELPQEATLERLARRLAAFNSRHAAGYALATSCGVARYSANAPRGLDQLLHEADAALYADKRARLATLRVAGPNLPTRRKTP